MNGVNLSVRFISVLVLMWDKGEMHLLHWVIYEYRMRLLVMNTSECNPLSQPHDGCSQDFKVEQLGHRTPIISCVSFISIWIFLSQTSALSLAYSKMCAICRFGWSLQSLRTQMFFSELISKLRHRKKSQNYYIDVVVSLKIKRYMI